MKFYAIKFIGHKKYITETNIHLVGKYLFGQIFEKRSTAKNYLIGARLHSYFKVVEIEIKELPYD